MSNFWNHFWLILWNTQSSNIDNKSIKYRRFFHLNQKFLNVKTSLWLLLKNLCWPSSIFAFFRHVRHVHIPNYIKVIRRYNEYHFIRRFHLQHTQAKNLIKLLANSLILNYVILLLKNHIKLEEKITTKTTLDPFQYPSKFRANECIIYPTLANKTQVYCNWKDQDCAQNKHKNSTRSSFFYSRVWEKKISKGMLSAINLPIAPMVIWIYSSIGQHFSFKSISIRCDEIVKRPCHVQTSSSLFFFNHWSGWVNENRLECETIHDIFRVKKLYRLRCLRDWHPKSKVLSENVSGICKDWR